MGNTQEQTQSVLKKAYDQLIKAGFSPIIPEEPRDVPEAIHERPAGMPMDVYRTIRKASKKAFAARLRGRRRICKASDGTIYKVHPFGYFTHSNTSPVKPA